MSYAIRLANGRFFVNVDERDGGTSRQALRFENRSAADNYLGFRWMLDFPGEVEWVGPGGSDDPGGAS